MDSDDAPPPPHAERAERHDTWLEARAVRDGRTSPMHVANLSRTGFLARLEELPAIGEGFVADLPRIGPRGVEMMRHVLEFAGCRFVVPLTAEEFDSLHAGAGDAPPLSTPLPDPDPFAPPRLVGRP